MSSGSPSQIVHVVGGPDAAESEQLVHGPAEQLALKVVQRDVERRPCGELSSGQALHDLLDRERVVAERVRMLFDVCERRLRRFVVAVDRGRLAEAVDAAARQRELHDLLFVAGAARDHECLGELQGQDPRLGLHAGEATLALPCARSSGDRARASGARGRRFDSCRAH